MEQITKLSLRKSNCATDKTNTLTLLLPTPYVTKNCSLALSKAIFYYSFSNIDNIYGNTSGVSYIFNGIEYPITFDQGYYTVAQMNEYLQWKMEVNGHYVKDSSANNVYFLKFEVDTIYYNVVLTATPITLPAGGSNPNGLSMTNVSPQLKITNNKWGKLIGFVSGTYPLTPANSETNIASSILPVISEVETFNISVPNLVNNARFSAFPNTIEEYVPASSASGSIIEIEPKNLIWYNMIDGSHSQITVAVIDQYGRDINFRDGVIGIQLLVRQNK
jgi:hypothetical protein